MNKEGFTCPGNFTLKGIETKGADRFNVSLKCNVSNCLEGRTFFVNGYKQGGTSAQDDAVSNAEQEMSLNCPLETLANE